MGLFGSRFNKPDNGTIHSSGIAAAGSSTFGSTSAESFSTRQQIDKNRTLVKRFQDATIHTSYRDHAFQVRSKTGPLQQASTGSSDTAQQVHTTRTGKAATSRIDASVPGGTPQQQDHHGHRRHTTRTGKSASSRIDIVKPTRQGFNAGEHANAAPANNPNPSPNAYKIERPTFGTSYKEPSSRGFNPYS